MKVIPRLGVSYSNENKPAQLSAITVQNKQKQKQQKQNDVIRTVLRMWQNRNDKTPNRLHFKTLLPPVGPSNYNIFIIRDSLYDIRSNSRRESKGKTLSRKSEGEEGGFLQTSSEVEHLRAGLALGWVTTFKQKPLYRSYHLLYFKQIFF